MLHELGDRVIKCKLDCYRWRGIKGNDCSLTVKYEVSMGFGFSHFLQGNYVSRGALNHMRTNVINYGTWVIISSAIPIFTDRELSVWKESDSLRNDRKRRLLIATCK